MKIKFDVPVGGVTILPHPIHPRQQAIPERFLRVMNEGAHVGNVSQERYNDLIGDEKELNQVVAENSVLKRKLLEERHRTSELFPAKEEEEGVSDSAQNVTVVIPQEQYDDLVDAAGRVVPLEEEIKKLRLVNGDVSAFSRHDPTDYVDGDYVVGQDGTKGVFVEKGRYDVLVAAPSLGGGRCSNSDCPTCEKYYRDEAGRL